jgi:hypothetical protein
VVCWIDSKPLKNFDSGQFEVGQKLLHCAGKKIRTVTFVSLGPRLGKGVGEDAVTNAPQSAIVRDKDGNLVTVNLADLKPVKEN